MSNMPRIDGAKVRIFFQTALYYKKNNGFYAFFVSRCVYIIIPDALRLHKRKLWRVFCFLNFPL